jgi:CelD/BcsL family acetyltransferase involved in cellulose biosynthesis
MPSSTRELDFTVVDDLEDLRDEWAPVARASRNVFATWEWLATWWQHFGRDKQLAVGVARDADGVVRAIVPCYLWTTRPVRIVRFLGHNSGAELGPICDPRDRGIAGKLLGWTVERTACDLFLGEGLHPSAPWAEQLTARVQRRSPCPVLQLEYRDWDAYLGSRSANFRQQLRRKERKLIREHGLEYRLVTGADRLDDHLDALFSLHSARWQDGETLFLTDGGKHFHRRFARLAAREGWLRLWFLELDGHPAAAWYGFRFEGVETYYQLGRDPEWERASVGLLVVAHSIREAIGDGVDEYRLGPGDQAYKYRFSDTGPEMETIVLPKTTGGKVAFLATDLVARSGVLRRAAAAVGAA